MEFVEVAQPASPLRWLADVLLQLVGARKLIQNDAREFLVKLIETNSTRVHSDILNRIQESRVDWKGKNHPRAESVPQHAVSSAKIPGCVVGITSTMSNEQIFSV